MSRIYFHSPSGDAEIRGSERAWMGILINDLFHVSLGLLHAYDTPSEPSPLRYVVNPNSHTLRSPNFLDSVRLTTNTAFETATFAIDGEMIDTFTAALNTAMLIGGDAIKLCARLHGQCEIHAWVEGPNRAWLAGIIRLARNANILRDDQGWEKLMEFLKSRDDEPVVTSYSVCDQFPNIDTSTWEPENDSDDARDKYWELSNEEQWRFGMEKLRQSPMMEMKPETWADYYWHYGRSGFDIRAAAWEKELEQRKVKEAATR